MSRLSSQSGILSHILPNFILPPIVCQELSLSSGPVILHWYSLKKAAFWPLCSQMDIFSKCTQNLQLGHLAPQQCLGNSQASFSSSWHLSCQMIIFFKMHRFTAPSTILVTSAANSYFFKSTYILNFARGLEVGRSLVQVIHDRLHNQGRVNWVINWKTATAYRRHIGQAHWQQSRRSMAVLTLNSGKWVSKHSNLHVNMGLGLSNSQWKTARKLTSPRPRVKSSTNDFVLTRFTLLLGIIETRMNESEHPYGHMHWLYTKSIAEIGRIDNIVASQRFQHREYRCAFLGGIQS